MLSSLLAGLLASAALSFADLPAGTYRYVQAESPAASLLFRKSGSVVIGLALSGPVEVGQRGVGYCFRGQAQGDRIIHVTRVAPPYSPASVWEAGQVYALTAAVHPATPTAAEQAALTACTQAFWR